MEDPITIVHGDCVDILAALPEGSVGAVVCDPPYGLCFMGKAFDTLGDGARQQEWHRRWLVEAFRVLRPEGQILAFCGTRTYHRLAAAMSEVGFTRLRVQAWTYGSGFPKSQNVGKTLDKAAGAEREIVGVRVNTYDGAKRDPTKHGSPADQAAIGKWGLNQTPHGMPLTAPATDAAKTWEGWGSNLKPAWEPIVCGVKP